MYARSKRNRKSHAEKMQEYRVRKKAKLGEQWYEKEAERLRKRYVPVAQLSEEEKKERRLKSSIYTQRYRQRRKLGFLPQNSTRTLRSSMSEVKDEGECSSENSLSSFSGQAQGSGYVFSNQSHDVYLCGRVRDMLRNGCLCDAAIEVGSRVFKAHKVVLAAGSSVFLNMATSLPDCGQMLVRLPVETDIPSLEVILDYMYTGRVHLSSTNCQDVHKLADLFDIKQLVEWCSRVDSGLALGGCTSEDLGSAGSESDSGEASLKINKSSSSYKGVGRPRGRGRGRQRGGGRGLDRGQTSKLIYEKTGSHSGTGQDINNSYEDLPFDMDTPRKANIKAKIVTSEILRKNDDIHSKDVKQMSSLSSANKRGRGGKSRAEIQRAYRERKIAGMTEKQLQEHRKKEAKRVRQGKSERDGIVQKGRGRGRGRAGLKVKLGQGRVAMKTSSKGITGSVKQEPETIERAEDYKRWRNKRKNDISYILKERERARKRYVPRKLLSAEALEDIREKTRNQQRNYRIKKCLRTLEEEHGVQIYTENAAAEVEGDALSQGYLLQVTAGDGDLNVPRGSESIQNVIQSVIVTPQLHDLPQTVVVENTPDMDNTAMQEQTSEPSNSIPMISSICIKQEALHDLPEEDSQFVPTFSEVDMVQLSTQCDDMSGSGVSEPSVTPAAYGLEATAESVDTQLDIFDTPNDNGDALADRLKAGDATPCNVGEMPRSGDVTPVDMDILVFDIVSACLNIKNCLIVKLYIT
ncbi:ZBT42-like protein [Mya arenaria]|uniref:ZBT42-like protein n=1 Tax=Mya arenaria TaxID=6604 RepID=A0ABY7E9U1_MYAAR|nr:ZBT42-like protein [Mya arenaria]